MNHLEEFKPGETIIGVIIPAGQSVEPHADILDEAKARGITWLPVEVSGDPASQDQSIIYATDRLLEFNVNLVIGAGHLIRGQAYVAAGVIALRSAYRAARIKGDAIHALMFLPGGVVDADQISKLSTPARYSHITIGKNIMAAGLVERTGILVSEAR